MLKKRKTLKEIAQEAGVSITAASLYLNGRAGQYRLSQELCSRLEAIFARENYTPNINARAMNAKNTYEGKNVRVSGVLSNIDASGKYFSIENDDEWSFESVTCYIKNDETRERIAGASTGDTLVVCGTITSVGEIMGYSIDVAYVE